MRDILKLWGWGCLGWTALYLLLAIWGARDPGVQFYPDFSNLGKWIGMGLISLGLARVIELLEKK